IETNIDDQSPELVADALESCRAAGALDVWATPTAMKKGRVGVILSALTDRGSERRVAEIILRETSTLGVRISRPERIELRREWRTVEVAGLPIRIKLGRLGDETVNMAP